MNSNRFSSRPANFTDRSRSHDFRQRSLQPAAAPEQDAAYSAAIEDGDFDTVLRLLQKAARKADMVAQAAWLLGRAIAAGYRSVDELVQADHDRFQSLAAEWRRTHPAFC